MVTVSKMDKLPEELLDEISRYVEPTDLLALRQVSRAISSATDKRFLDTFFTSRVHLYTLHGVQALADIAKEPRLIRRIQRVTLIFVQPNTASGTNRGLPMKRWNKQNYALHRDDLHIKLLNKFFNAVTAGTYSTTFETTITSVDSAHAYGTATITKFLGLRHLIANPTDLRKPINFMIPLLAGIKASMPSTLRILPDGLLQPEAFDFKRPLDKQLTFFSRLQVLEVHHGPVYYEISYEEQIPTLKRGFLTLLHNAINLQVLVISGYGGWMSSRNHDGSLFRSFAKHIPSQAPLRQLELSWFDVCEQDVIQLLQRKCQTVRHLSLREFTLAKHETWDGILSAMEERLNLEKLELAELRCDNEEFENPPERTDQLTLRLPYKRGAGSDDEDFGDVGVSKTTRCFSFEGCVCVIEGLQKLRRDGIYEE